MKEEYTAYGFESVSKYTGTYDECAAYIRKHGGTLYTQVDCDTYDEGGVKRDFCYVKGNRFVNRTGWYGVV